MERSRNRRLTRSSFLEHFAQSIWHLANGRIQPYTGGFAAFQTQRHMRAQQEEQHYQELKEKTRQLTTAIDQENKRAARSARHGKKRYQNDKMVRNDKREKAQNHEATHQKASRQELKQTRQELAHIRSPRKNNPKFHFRDDNWRKNAVLEIRDGAFGHGETWLFDNLNLYLQPGERLAIRGSNGSGKTTLLRALLDEPLIARKGEWSLPASRGYLDQSGALLKQDSTPWNTVKEVRNDWTSEEIRIHLNRFLFVHHASFERPIAFLSEGEKMRLALCSLAAAAPSCLLLDEPTNNLDITTKTHLAEVLSTYQGTLIIVCHEKSFLKEVGVQSQLHLDPIAGKVDIH